MKRVIAAAFVSALSCQLVSCSDGYSENQTNGRFTRVGYELKDEDMSRFRVICDTRENVSYIEFNGYQRYGITVMLDHEGKPIPCNRRYDGQR